MSNKYLEAQKNPEVKKDLLFKKKPELALELIDKTLKRVNWGIKTTME